MMEETKLVVESADEEVQPPTPKLIQGGDSSNMNVKCKTTFVGQRVPKQSMVKKMVPP
jgi:hypothetical protein